VEKVSVLLSGQVLTRPEAGMRLMRELRSFDLHTSRDIMRLMGHSDDKWRKYLY
jgi:hypothetical protein